MANKTMTSLYNTYYVCGLPPPPSSYRIGRQHVGGISEPGTREQPPQIYVELSVAVRGWRDLSVNCYSQRKVARRAPLDHCQELAKQRPVDQE